MGTDGVGFNPIPSFGWDQDEYGKEPNFVYIYVTSGVDGVGDIKERVSCDFKKDSKAKLLFSQQWGAGTQIRTRWSSSVEHKRMSTINFRLASHHRDRALYHAYAKIDEKATSLPDSVRVHAKLFYKRFTELKLTRGDVRLGATANCIIMACKLAGISRTNAEVADMWGIDVRHVTRTSELVRQTLASDAYRTAHTNTTGTTYGAKPRELLARIWNRFDTTDAITGRERRDAEF